jgi:hypothetical protein
MGEAVQGASARYPGDSDPSTASDAGEPCSDGGGSTEGHPAATGRSHSSSGSRDPSSRSASNAAGISALSLGEPGFGYAVVAGFRSACEVDRAERASKGSGSVFDSCTAAQASAADQFRGRTIWPSLDTAMGAGIRANSGSA